FHFPVGSARVEAGSDSVTFVTAGDGDRVAGIVVAPSDPNAAGVKVVEGQSAPIQGWYAPRYSILEPAPAAVYERGFDGRAVYHTVLYPFPGEHAPQIKVRDLPV